MKRKKFNTQIFSVSIILLLLITSCSFCQLNNSFVDSAYTSNFLYTTLENNLNSARLTSRLNYYKMAGKFEFYLKNYYSSDVTKLNTNFYRDLDNFKFLALYKLSEKLKLGAGVKNNVLSDDRIIESNINNNSFFYGNVKYSINNSTGISTNLGFKRENQLGEITSGFSGELNSDINDLRFNDFNSSTNLFLSIDAFDKKKNYDNELYSELYKRFSNRSVNSGKIKFYNQRKDFFTPATQSVINAFGVRNNIQSRFENAIQLEDQFIYSLSRNFDLNLGGLYMTRVINNDYKYGSDPSVLLLENVYNTKTLEDRLELNSYLSFNSSKLTGYARMNYAERTEDHEVKDISGLTVSQLDELEKTEKNKNNSSKRTSLNVDGTYYFSNTNRIILSTNASILHYDTDSRLNYDDRDEQNIIYSVSHGYSNLSGFDAVTTFDVNISKLKYLFAQRSANNYSNRIYRLTSQSVFKPVKILTSRNTFQVLANYTVYDFEDIISQIKSYSYRQLNMRDSTLISLSPKLDIEFYSEVKAYEQGEFNNNAFSVKPVSYNFLTTLGGNIIYSLLSNLKISAGYGSFRQKIYNYTTGEKVLINTLSNNSITGKIFLYLSKSSIISFIYSLEKYSDQFQPENTSNSIQMNIFWNM
ncbi:hypothetical protein BH10BAC5_BH10BAC5_05180 [soil metagenome]